jgi:hypothetical protein
MRSKYILIAVVLITLAFGLGRLSAAPGTLDSPGDPFSDAAKMYTLEDIYNRLNDGTEGAQSTFTEPAAGPGTGTMHDLNEIMAKAPVIDNTSGATETNVLDGKTFWGLTGGQWGPQAGTMPDREGDNASTAQGESGGVNYFTAPDGYYDGDDTVTATDAEVRALDAQIAAGKIKKDVNIFGQVGTLTPDGGTAVAADLFRDETAHLTNDWTLDTGTLDLACNDPAFNGTANKVPNAYDGAGNGENRWCMTDSGDAAVADIRDGKKAWVDGSEVTGDLTPDGGTATVADLFNGQTAHLTNDWTLDTGTLDLACNDPTFDGTANKVPNAYDGSGGNGENRWCMTDSGDAAVADIRDGKKAWVDGSEVTGNVAAGSNVDGPEGAKSFTIPNRLYSGSKTCTANDTDLVAGNIKCGVTIFGVTGAIPPDCVAKTGQTTSYATGDDGAYRKGCLPVVAPSGGYSFGGYNRTSFTCLDGATGFEDNGDGTVTDNLTGLVWLKNADCLGFVSWANALTKANGLASGSCGLTDGSSAGDWRLPNLNELRSLFDPGLSPLYLPAGHPFTDVKGRTYWSSTTLAGGASDAWLVILCYGRVSHVNKTANFYVWAVRGGQ